MNKLTRYAGNLFILLLAIPLLLMGYWWVFPDDPVIFKSVAVLTPQVHPGDELRILVDMKKKSIYPSLIAKTLISCDSNLVYPLPIETGALPSGDHRVIVEVRIPTVVNPGKYSLRSVSVFSVNPVMQVVKSYTTPCFEVVK